MSYPIPASQRPLWDRAIEFIAHNDDDGAPDATEFRVVLGYVSVATVAETFGVHREKVARAVVKLRRQRATLAAWKPD